VLIDRAAASRIPQENQAAEGTDEADKGNEQRVQSP
jgi:hypothetical protein